MTKKDPGNGATGVRSRRLICRHPAAIQDLSDDNGVDTCEVGVAVDLAGPCRAAPSSSYGEYTDECAGCAGPRGVFAEVKNPIVLDRLEEQWNVINSKRRAKGQLEATLRIGRAGDPGHRRHRADLLTLLDFCKRRSIVPIVESAALDYDPDVATLLMRSAGTLILFPRAGRVAGIRTTTGLRYLDGGVNLVAGMCVNPAEPYRDPSFDEDVEKIMARFPGVLLFASCWSSRVSAEALLGDDFETRKAPNGSFLYAWHRKYYSAVVIHPRIRELAEDNRGAVRLCMTGIAGEFCGRCFIDSAKTPDARRRPGEAVQ